MTLGGMGYGFGVSKCTGGRHTHRMAGLVADMLGYPTDDIRIVGRICLVNRPLVSTFRGFPSRSSSARSRGDRGLSVDGSSAARKECRLPDSGHKMLRCQVCSPRY